MNYHSTMNFADYGSGVTSMASMADRGLKNVFGSMAAAGAAVAAQGKLFNTKDMGLMGKAAGLIDQLRKNKMGNATGLNQLLVRAGVDPNKANDPANEEKVKTVLGFVTDPSVISTVANQMDVTPHAGLPTIPGDTISNIYDQLNWCIARLDNWINALAGWTAELPNISSGLDMEDLKQRYTNAVEHSDYVQAITDANNISITSIRPLPNDQVKLDLTNYRNDDVEAKINAANKAVRDFAAAVKARKAEIAAGGTDPTLSAATNNNTNGAV